MAGEFDIRPMVEKNSAIPVDRFRVVRNFDALRLSEIRRGIVFVFAAWSGPAVVAFQRFTRIMKSIETRTLDLVVLDTVCLTQNSAGELLGDEDFTFGGWDEVIWIRDGKVAARTIARDGSEVFLEEHTKGLLDAGVA
jgi:hypothetical protein